MKHSHGKKAAMAVSVIGGSDGPTSIWLAGKEKEKNPLRALSEQERSDRLRAYMEACQSMQERAAELPESILPIDYHCYRIVPEDGSEIHIEMEKVHDFMAEGCSASCGPCRVGGRINRRNGKQKMKRAQAIMHDIVRYHGVSEKDIAEKNERYRGLLTSLTD